MLIVALVFSGILLLITNIAARRYGGIPGATSIAALSVVPAALFICVSPILLLPPIALTISGFACVIVGAGPKGFLRASVAAILLTYVLVGLSVTNRLWVDDQLAKRYPYQSIQERLAYEKEPIAASKF